ncbi:hypothetical protein ACFX1W_040974 [Malus domestica]
MPCCSFSSCRQGTFDVNLSSDLGEAFLANFIAMSLNRLIEEVFREEIVHHVEISSSSFHVALEVDESLFGLTCTVLEHAPSNQGDDIE